MCRDQGQCVDLYGQSSPQRRPSPCYNTEPYCCCCCMPLCTGTFPSMLQRGRERRGGLGLKKRKMVNEEIHIKHDRRRRYGRQPAGLTDSLCVMLQKHTWDTHQKKSRNHGNNHLLFFSPCCFLSLQCCSAILRETLQPTHCQRGREWMDGGMDGWREEG